ncbi:MAG TPA: ankyrin repeat domain-containing protein [Pyrinomonadaceae bacterium]|jgi:ankyrin repeat protein
MTSRSFVLVLSTLLFLPVAATGQNSKQELNDQLFEAVRKGDVAAVTAALDKGADVNAKFRYGTTALFKAAERGHADVAKVLLDRGADLKVKDTFYGATAMSWALDGDHIDVVQLFLEKSSDEVEDVLMKGARENKPGLVKLALDSKSVKPETLTVALAVSSSDEKEAAITEMLKKAGAQPPLQLDAALLQSYAGKYKGNPGPEVTITVKDGKSFVSFGREPQPLMPLDKTTFRPLAFDGITLSFNVEGDKVTGLALKQGQDTTQLKRIGDVSH